MLSPYKRTYTEELPGAKIILTWELYKASSIVLMVLMTCIVLTFVCSSSEINEDEMSLSNVKRIEWQHIVNRTKLCGSEANQKLCCTQASKNMHSSKADLHIFL